MWVHGSLPAAWEKGYIHGLMVRGGFEVDMDWENGKLKQAKITSKLGNPLKLSYAGKVTEIANTEKGKTYLLGEDVKRVN